jgi:hypothetical protein
MVSLSYTFKTQALIIILLPVFQIILTGLVTEGYLNSMQLWLDLFGSMASIGIALYNGFTAGFDAARNGYKPVVQERINTIQEVLNIEKEKARSLILLAFSFSRVRVCAYLKLIIIFSFKILFFLSNRTIVFS